LYISEHNGIKKVNKLYFVRFRKWLTEFCVW